MPRWGWPDMRENVRAYLDGDFAKLGEGQWLVYRRMLKGELTKQWSPTRDEAVGGEKFKYVQYMVRGIIQPIGGEFGLSAIWATNEMGIVPKGGFLAMIKWDYSQAKTRHPLARPQIGDRIFEVLGGDSKSPPKQPIRLIGDYAYKVLSVGKSRGDFGRSEGWILHVDLDG